MRHLQKLITRSLALFWITGLVLTAPADSGNENEMLAKYESFKQFRSTQSLPFMLESNDAGAVSHASVSYILEDVPFGQFVSELAQVSEWCEFIPIHLNIKACAYTEDEANPILRFYVGVKTYLTPDKASLLKLSFDSGVEDTVFFITMTAKSGPYGSSNYNFQIHAIEVDEGIFLEFDLSSEPGVAASVAAIYFLTVARKKIGFSVGGKTWSGKVKYVGGQRGAAERNVVRYLLAIKAYFETLDLPESVRFEQRIDRWFSATEQYPKQLREMSREAYISIKQRERANQEILIAALRNNVLPVYEEEIEKNR